MFAEVTQRMQIDIAQQTKKRKRIREVDCFVLDNSICESNIGQIRGHTLENKWKIYEEVKKCGFKHIIVAAFSYMTRVDDTFVKELGERGEDMHTLYAFADVTEDVKDGVLDTTTLPVTLKKMKQHGLHNPILEIDLADKRIDWDGKFTVENLCDLLLQRIEWSLDNLIHEVSIFVNIRDLAFAMIEAPERVFTVIRYLALLPEHKRPLGLMFEEPSGQFLPEELGVWTASVRQVMKDNNWSGHLLVHLHEKWGLAESSQLECLGYGADGIWCSLCQEGAALGHACSSIALMNLIRMGNKQVLKRYNCTYLRKAAINITRITVGVEPYPKQVIYGERALDVTFDLDDISGGRVSKGEFDMAAFFGVHAPVRISTYASTAMILERLNGLFDDDPHSSRFTEDIAICMKALIIEDLTSNRKEEYSSKVGIALLFDRAGGSLTEQMRDEIDKDKAKLY